MRRFVSKWLGGGFAAVRLGPARVGKHIMRIIRKGTNILSDNPQVIMCFPNLKRRGSGATGRATHNNVAVIGTAQTSLPITQGVISYAEYRRLKYGPPKTDGILDDIAECRKMIAHIGRALVD